MCGKSVRQKRAAAVCNKYRPGVDVTLLAYLAAAKYRVQGLSMTGKFTSEGVDEFFLTLRGCDYLEKLSEVLPITWQNPTSVGHCVAASISGPWFGWSQPTEFVARRAIIPRLSLEPQNETGELPFRARPPVAAFL